MPRFRMFSLRANNVLQLYQWRNQINLSPPYQRLAVWDNEKRQSFVDSVLNGFDVPKLYFHDLTADQSAGYRFSVIDGKQRLLSLWDFISRKLALSQDFVFFDDVEVKAGGLTYDDLMTKFPRLRARFDSFEVPVTVVQTEDENFIEELFARLNIQVPLSAPERRNALGGPLPYLIRKVGTAPFFQESVRIPNNRLQHFDLAAKFLYLTHVGQIASTKRLVLDEFVRSFKRDRDTGSLDKDVLQCLEKLTLKLLGDMREYFGRKDLLLSSQGRTTLYFHVFKRYRQLGRRVDFPKKVLEEFNESVTEARRKSQKRAEGKEERLSEREQRLVFFDREKQTPNDAGAVRRQYNFLREDLKTVFDVELPPVQD